MNYDNIDWPVGQDSDGERDKSDEKGMYSMTICIAAICDAETKNPKIVLCADRALGDEYTRSVMNHPKINIIENKFAVMWDDEYNLSKRVFELAEILIKDFKTEKKVNTATIAAIFSTAMEEVLLGDIDRKIFRKRGLSFKSFYGEVNFGILSKIKDRIKGDKSEFRKNVAYDNWFNRRIDSAVAEYKSKVDFIVAGIDEENGEAIPRIYKINSNGEVIPDTKDGVSTIGVAWGFKMFEERDPITPENKLADVLAKVYIFKRLSQFIFYISDETDTMIMTKKGIFTIEEDLAKELEKGYTESLNNLKNTNLKVSRIVKEIIDKREFEE